MDGKGGQAPVYDLFDTLMSNSTPGGFLFLMRSVLSFKGYDGFLESRKGGGRGTQVTLKYTWEV